jgi:hypothetical protein
MDSMDAPHRLWVDRKMLDQAVDIAEALANLNYLICVESEKPALVRWYSDQADEQIQKLGDLLRSIDTA